jgi:N-acetylmuramoyl-L-alanine amidase
LIKKYGLEPGTTIKTVPTGKMYKYQAGSFSSYESAKRLLRQMIGKGYRDAFIVAYRGAEQIPLEKALDLSK